MDSLNLNLLRALDALLRLRNVTHAARELHLTQSAMSRQLAQLREHFADPLLIREGSHYLPTRRALSLQPEISRLLAEIAALNDSPEFNPAACTRNFTFAATDYVAQYIFPDVLQALADTAPGVQLSFQVWQQDMLPRLGQLPLDMASTMAAEVPENVHGLHLGQDEPVCLMHRNHPLRGQPTLQQLTEWPHARLSSGGDKDTFLDRQLAAAGLARQVRFSVPFYSAAFAALAQSELLLIVPRHIAANAARILPLRWEPLPPPLPEHHYSLYWHAIHQQDPAHRWLREMIAEVTRRSMWSPQPEA